MTWPAAHVRLSVPIVGYVTHSFAWPQTRVLEEPSTTIWTSSVAVAPRLSVTVRRKTYEPAARPVTAVLAAAGLAIAAAPPEVFVQAYEAIEPSLSEPLPESVTELAVMLWSTP